jgi:hypothetical protein
MATCFPAIVAGNELGKGTGLDTARDKLTLELVEAEELWTMEHVDKGGYTCSGCVTQVHPASFDKEKNKRRPYFSLRDKLHRPGCDVDGAEKIVARARKEKVRSPDGFPLPFPSKLSLADERPVVGGGMLIPQGGPEGLEPTKGGTADPSKRRHHGHTVKTIRPACRAFVNFPNDRDALPLEIPDLPGKTYAGVFKYIGRKKPEPLNMPRRLFYSAIRWKANGVKLPECFEITLNAGEWIQADKEFKSLCKVRVDWSGWSAARRTSLETEFEVARDEAMEQAKKDSKVKGWCFFVGTQDDEDPTLFHVNDRRLICCLPAHMIWPD